MAAVDTLVDIHGIRSGPVADGMGNGIVTATVILVVGGDLIGTRYRHRVEGPGETGDIVAVGVVPIRIVVVVAPVRGPATGAPGVAPTDGLAAVGVIHHLFVGDGAGAAAAAGAALAVGIRGGGSGGGEDRVAAVADAPVVGIDIGEVEFPQIALQIPGIGVVGDIIAGDIHQRGRRQPHAAGGGDFLDQGAGVELHHKKAGVAAGLMVAVAEYGAPAAIGQPHDGGLAEGVTQIGIITIGKLPKYNFVGLGFCVAVGVGDIQGEEALAAAPQPCHQNGAPAGTGIAGREVAEGILHGHGAIHAVLVAVILVRKGLQLAEYLVGHIGQHLFAGVGIEAVQHAVIGADEDHLAAVFIGALESVVGGALHVVGIVEIGRADIEWVGVDHIPQRIVADTKLPATDAFVAAVAAQVIEHRLSGQIGLLAAGEIGPAEGHAAAAIMGEDDPFRRAVQ